MSDKKYFAKIDYSKSAKCYRDLCIFCLLISLFIPFFGAFGFLMPTTERVDIWFQRSGSLVVLISSLAEFFAVSMMNVFNPIKLANEPDFTTKVTYGSQAKALIIVSALFICAGTVIWGYGDLLV